MAEQHSEIIRAFIDNPDKKLTINQISKLIKRSYFFTNTNARKLIQEGVLNKEIIGHSILCSLNFNNDKTIGLLITNSMKKKNNTEAKDKRIKDAQILINELKSKTIIYTAFLKDKLVIVAENELEAARLLQSKDLKNLEIEIIGKENFSKEHLINSIIIYGFEEFWRLVHEKRGKDNEF